MFSSGILVDWKLGVHLPANDSTGHLHVTLEQEHLGRIVESGCGVEGWEEDEGVPPQVTRPWDTMHHLHSDITKEEAGSHSPSGDNEAGTNSPNEGDKMSGGAGPDLGGVRIAVTGGMALAYVVQPYATGGKTVDSELMPGFLSAVADQWST
jgi:hypothetical protein